MQGVVQGSPSATCLPRATCHLHPLCAHTPGPCRTCRYSCCCCCAALRAAIASDISLGRNRSDLGGPSMSSSTASSARASWVLNSPSCQESVTWQSDRQTRNPMQCLRTTTMATTALCCCLGSIRVRLRLQHCKCSCCWWSTSCMYVCVQGNTCCMGASLLPAAAHP
jgi:hypothetical protein